MWLNRQESINVGYHLATFGGHRYSGGEDIVVLVCHVISQDHAIKWSCDIFLCTCLPNLVVRSLREMDILILKSILTWIPWKKVNSPPRFAILRDFKIRNTDLQFRSSGYGWEKNEKKKNNTCNCKAFCVSRKHNKRFLLKPVKGVI